MSLSILKGHWTVLGNMLFLNLILGFGTGYADNSTLFTMGGKKVTASELPPRVKQSLYEIEMERYEKTKRLLDQAILDMKLTKDAKGKDLAEYKQQLFKVGEPSEKEIKKWYEENKARVPYPLDKIKGEIKNFIVSQKRNDLEQNMIKKIKKQEKVAFLMKEPSAPTLDISYKGYPFKGGTNAKVTIVEFADYQCPHCFHAFENLNKIVKKYGDKVKVVFMDFPINRSGVSKVVAEGGYCAKMQDKFWEYHAKAFNNQRSLSKDSPKKFAEELKLNTKDFSKCLTSNEAIAHVAKSKAEGEKIGVSGTPSIYINGKRVLGIDVEAISKEIDAAI